jgi:hypothetical protein
VIHARRVLALVVAALAAVTLTGCAFHHWSGSGRIVVSATGRIGPLRVDESGRADVISFAGQPDSESHGRSYAAAPPFDALGYGCRGKVATDKYGIPRCKTIFYLDSRSGKLALLYTEDKRYVDPHGVHVGTPTPVAERLLHRRPFNGCYSGFRFETKTGFLVMWLYGGKGVGDHVGLLVVHSQHLNPGVLDCIDS